jgi:hypothetical protein
VSQFDRLRGKLVEISPEVLTPATSAARYTYLGENRFKLIHGGHNGGFGEVMEAVKDPDPGVTSLVIAGSVLEPFKIPE